MLLSLRSQMVTSNPRVCALESDLAAQHTAARYHHFTNHQKISLLVNRAHLAQMVSF